MYRPLQGALVVAAVTALAIGATRPRAWVLALLLFVVLCAVWFYAIMVWVRHTDADEPVPSLDEGLDR